MKIERPVSKQPIPPDARRVFHGQIFDVYQWPQKLFDGTTVVFEKIKRADTVLVIPVTADGQIVLTEQEQPGKAPFLGAAGGRVNEGEDVLTAAKRELLEETGYTAGDFLLWDAIQPVSKIEWAVYTFIAKDCQKVREPQPEGGEKIRLKLVSFDEFIDVVSQGRFQDVEITLRLLREGIRVVDDPDKKEALRRLFLGD